MNENYSTVYQLTVWPNRIDSEGNYIRVGANQVLGFYESCEAAKSTLEYVKRIFPAIVYSRYLLGAITEKDIWAVGGEYFDSIPFNVAVYEARKSRSTEVDELRNNQTS